MNHNYKTQQELVLAQAEGKRFKFNGTIGHWYFNNEVHEYELVGEQVKPVSKKRKHADVIIAWANGEDVQVQLSDGNWVDVHSPLFDENTKYRVNLKEQASYYIARSTCLINSTEQEMLL